MKTHFININQPIWMTITECSRYFSHKVKCTKNWGKVTCKHCINNN